MLLLLLQQLAGVTASVVGLASKVVALGLGVQVYVAMFLAYEVVASVVGAAAPANVPAAFIRRLAFKIDFVT